MVNELTQLKSSDIKQVRDDILKEQNGTCKLCNNPITEQTGISLDHQHKLKSAKNGPDGNGLIRGVLCRACNVLEGKIWNSCTRYIQPTCVQDRIDILKSLINYYKQKPYNLIHPNEKPKEQIVSKRNYNKLKKLYTKTNRKKKFPDYPKSKKLTKALSTLFIEFSINPYN